MKSFTNTARSINLPDITSHRLRHTFASLTKDVLTSAEVKLTLGHSEAMNTDTYVHRLKNDHVKVGQKLADLFDGLIPKVQRKCYPEKVKPRKLRANGVSYGVPDRN